VNFRIGTFNCKNFVYDNKKSKFNFIVDIIDKSKVDMLLLQEFATSGDKKDLISRHLPVGWDIVLYHSQWKQDALYSIIYKKIPGEPFDDTDNEYMRNPSNDNGYAILWNKKKFTLMDLTKDDKVKKVLDSRNQKNNLARPPQIEFFHIAKFPNKIFSVMNTHLTYSGKFELFQKLRAKGFSAIRDYKKSPLEIIARIDEMGEVLDLYRMTNSLSINGSHYTTILGGDFNLSINDLTEVQDIPEDHNPSTTGDYNKNITRDAAEATSRIYASNAEKTTLHKVYKEKPGYDYKYHSYDHFIINQENCRTEVLDSVKEFFYDESKDKSPRNDDHYSDLSDHLPVIVTVNI